VALLESPERPIVLLPRAQLWLAEALPGVAPGLHTLGVMLPCTPIQYLLFHEAAGRPQGLAWLQKPQDLVLVMTSANPGGEPLVTGNPEALQRLQGLADAWLLHDRDIVARCDDSVLRPAAGGSAAVHPPRARLHAQRHPPGAAAAPACWPPAPG
jgi:hydrogenase maturation protein HypF